MNMTWDLEGDDIQAVCIQIAADPEFTSFLNVFVLPKVTGAILDPGLGYWYFRVGCFVGKKTEGKVVYSAIYGPAFVPSPKPPQRLSPPSFAILHARKVVGGARFHTDRSHPSYAVIEYCKHSKFNASDTTTKYVYDVGHGYFDILGLDPLYSYSIRISSWEGDHTIFPTNITRLEQFRATHNLKPNPVPKRDSGSRVATHAAAAAILQEARERPVMKFSSHTDYLKYLANKAEAERS
jgi:hypothetical protein